MNFNKCFFAGNLTRDVDVRFTQGGTAVADVSIAVNSRFTSNGEKKEKTTFIDCVAWGKTAEIIGEYCEKGKAIFVTCEAEQQTWDDKETGQKRSKMVFRISEFQFVGGRGGGSSNDEGGDEKPKTEPKKGSKTKGSKKKDEPQEDQRQQDQGGDDAGLNDEVPF